VSRATPRRVQDGCLSKWDRARVARLESAGEVDRICALELALEEPIELLITRRLLAILDADGIGLGYGKDKSFSGEEHTTYGVARLLSKDLGKLDHIRRVQFLGEVHHYVGIVLLIARTCGGEKSAKGVDSDGIALLCASRGVLVIATVGQYLSPQEWN